MSRLLALLLGALAGVLLGRDGNARPEPGAGGRSGSDLRLGVGALFDPAARPLGPEAPHGAVLRLGALDPTETGACGEDAFGGVAPREVLDRREVHFQRQWSSSAASVRPALLAPGPGRDRAESAGGECELAGLVHLGLHTRNLNLTSGYVKGFLELFFGALAGLVIAVAICGVGGWR